MVIYNCKVIEVITKIKKEVEIMKKTFYTVHYTGIGYNDISTAWFDNKEEADKFAARDYADKPVRHTFSRPEVIREAERLVEITRG